MTKLYKNLLGWFRFRDRGIVPARNLLGLFFGVLIGNAFGGWVSWRYLVIFNLFMFFLSLVDLFFSPRKHELTFKRSIEAEMERGLKNPVEIEIRNQSSRSFLFRMVDGLPESFEKPILIYGRASKKETTKVTYETVATVRGKYHVNRLYFRYRTKLGLWEKQLTVLLEDEVKVIPDLTETRHYLENAQQFLFYEGAKIRKQRVGVGDFSKIRSYVVGDDPRKINWRQTAKQQEVMMNEYEPEHGKYVTVLIDCGRMMGAELTKGNRLEKALEAALTVIAAALKMGDYVSVLAFSREIKVYVPPGKGIGHMKNILQGVYNLKVDAAESDYSSVLQYLEMVQKKRSLLLLFSDVRTFLFEESALTYLKRLRQRHLFFIIGIEDVTLLKRVQDEPVDVQTAMMKSIAQQQMLIKKREKAKWEKQGLLILEAREEKLAAAAVSQYIEIMNQNLL